MRKSLFALENADGMDAGEEMEVSQEEGEVADVAVGADDEIGEIGDVADAVSDGSEAAGQMEEVQDLVEDAVENGEGLDPVAAEAVRISVEAICARIGANPKAVYSLYATENFASASSRRANSRIALEGIGEFLKDLWKRIKAALTNMWKKVKDFWAKHLSSLGRVKKALEATKVKVRASSGKFKQSAMIDKAPSSMSSAFAGKGNVDKKRVEAYIAGQVSLSAANTAVGNSITTIANLAGNASITPESVNQAFAGAVNTFTSTPVLIIGGENLVFKGEIVEDGKKITIDVEKESGEEVDSEAGMLAAGKDELTALLDSTLGVIKASIDTRKKTEKAEKDTNDCLSKIEAVLAKNDASAAGGLDDDKMKAVRIIMNGLYKMNAASAKIQGICASQNIRLAKAVIGFATTSMSQYK